jgi:hypothetical protein
MLEGANVTCVHASSTIQTTQSTVSTSSCHGPRLICDCVINRVASDTCCSTRGAMHDKHTSLISLTVVHTTAKTRSTLCIDLLPTSNSLLAYNRSTRMRCVLVVWTPASCKECKSCMTVSVVVDISADCDVVCAADLTACLETPVSAKQQSMTMVQPRCSSAARGRLRITTCYGSSPVCCTVLVTIGLTNCRTYASQAYATGSTSHEYSKRSVHS